MTKFPHLLTLFLLLSLPFEAHTQCSPDSSLAANTTSPSSFPMAYVGSPISETLVWAVARDTVSQSIPITFDSAGVSSIQNIPNWLNFSCNGGGQACTAYPPADTTLPILGCIQFFGTPTTCGDFDIEITLRSYFAFFNNPVYVDQTHYVHIQVIQHLLFPDFNYNANQFTVSFSFGTTGPLITQSWAFGDGQTAIGSDPVHTYDSAGTYWVCHTLYGPCNTVDTWCDSVLVPGDPLLPVPSGVDQYGIARAGISIGYDPAKGLAWINSEKEPLRSLEVWDLHGRLVREVTIVPAKAGRHGLEMNGLPPSMYLLRIRTAKGDRLTLRMTL